MRRSPQEKKALSYARDRRNVYGENDKSSRRSISGAKRRVVRANRRARTIALASARGVADAGAGAAAQERFERRRPKRWQKWPDAPLAQYVELTLARRSRAEGGKGRSAERLARVRRAVAPPGALTRRLRPGRGDPVCGAPAGGPGVGRRRQGFPQPHPNPCSLHYCGL
ncbi:hypothetical protein ACFWTE_02740 [Nocardiopsis sp. NPDC058631]|uniref:hypothetical protein n=1 Tax=Nocardiopsis sp. NPDC058631 TaxID=3346566 RepID=UPI00364E70FE